MSQEPVHRKHCRSFSRRQRSSSLVSLVYQLNERNYNVNQFWFSLNARFKFTSEIEYCSHFQEKEEKYFVRQRENIIQYVCRYVILVISIRKKC